MLAQISLTVAKMSAMAVAAVSLSEDATPKAAAIDWICWSDAPDMPIAVATRSFSPEGNLLMGKGLPAARTVGPISREWRLRQIPGALPTSQKRPPVLPLHLLHVQAAVQTRQYPAGEKSRAVRVLPGENA
jgi:hypothetical protein